MDRRSLLGLLASGLAATAGCGTRPIPGETPTSTPASSPDPTGTPRSPATTTTAAPTPTATESPTERPPPSPTGSPTPAPAPVEVVSITAPTTAEIGAPVPYSFTVSNRGSGTATVEPTVSTRSAGSDWTVRDRWDPVTLAPGGRHTFQGTPIGSGYLGTVELRIDGFDRTVAVEFVERRLAVGETVRDPLDRIVGVYGIGTRTAYTYTTSSGNRRTVEAGEGLQWVLVTVGVENRAVSSVEAPGIGGFTLRAGDTTYRSVGISGDSGYEQRRLPRRDTERGWIGFRTPRSVAREDAVVRWVETFADGEVGVVWEP